jgi:hypothetical protein
MSGQVATEPICEQGEHIDNFVGVYTRFRE